MTHQEISDAFETIYARAREVAKAERDWIDAERNRLRLECATVGHVFGRDRSLWGMGRACIVCGVPAPSDD